MKASAVAAALNLLVSARQPVFIWGGPGIGKSDVVRQLAKAMGVPLKDIRALLLDPVDLRGLPFLGADHAAKWATPDFLPKDGEGILFLDELNAASAMVQAGCYQLVLDRRLGEYTLPDGWSIIAAGNRETDRAVTTRMPTPLRNRFTHLNFEVDVQMGKAVPERCGHASRHRPVRFAVSCSDDRPALGECVLSESPIQNKLVTTRLNHCRRSIQLVKEKNALTIFRQEVRCRPLCGVVGAEEWQATEVHRIQQECSDVLQRDSRCSCKLAHDV